MPSVPPSTPPATARAELRALSLSQLHQLAQKGSRRAHTELERRMRAAVVGTPAAPPAAPNVPAAAPHAAIPNPPNRPNPRTRPTPPLLTDRAPVQPPESAVLAGQQAQIDRWALLERQALAHSRASGPPRLVGLVLIGWALVLGLGALVLLAQGGGAYYLLCALGSAVVGRLLMQRSRWAYVAQGLVLLAALAWAGRGGNAALALVQAAPAWIAALWMAVTRVREGLD